LPHPPHPPRAQDLAQFEIAGDRRRANQIISRATNAGLPRALIGRPALLAAVHLARRAKPRAPIPLSDHALPHGGPSRRVRHLSNLKTPRSQRTPRSHRQSICCKRVERAGGRAAAISMPRCGRKQSVVSRQGVVLAVFRVVPKINIKFLSEFWGQTSYMIWVSGCRLCDHVLIIT
jgi:hypothetical protein